MLYAFGVGEIAVSISGANRRALLRSHGAGCRCRQRGAREAGVGATVGLRGPFGSPGRSRRREGRRRAVRGRRPGACAAATRHLCGARESRPLRPRDRSGRQPQSVQPAVRGRVDAMARDSISSCRSRSTMRIADWRGQVGVVPALIRRAAFDAERRDRHDLRTGTDDAIHGERPARGRHRTRANLSLDGAQHEVRDRAYAAIASSGPRSSARTARSCDSTRLPGCLPMREI